MLGVQKANGESLFKKKKEKNIISPQIYSRTVKTQYSLLWKKISNKLWKSLQ